MPRLRDFRARANLLVEPVSQTLNVKVTGQSKVAGPGDEFSFEMQVTDAQGNPVQGEFSLAVVDLAALALADPNSLDIVSAFYSPIPNGVSTGISLAAYNRRQTFFPLGMGEGGGAEPTVVRSALSIRPTGTPRWSPARDGKASVSLELPDTLTTWQVDTRGLTPDTRVGSDKTQVVATKDLLVRPVTPRFLVAGDHAQVAAVVQNTSSNNLQVDVTLEGAGFVLDDASTATQKVNLSPNGRARVEWWGVAQDADVADLVFSARSTVGSYQDAARPSLGPLPVLRYVTPQAFRTAGTLDQGGEVTELASLPRSFSPKDGQLEVELSPSLAAAMLKSLDVLETTFESTNRSSPFLPNLGLTGAVQYGIDLA
jgi:uncharacterized protein YfaS (alpha-2-macroglobulin family)